MRVIKLPTRSPNAGAVSYYSADIIVVGRHTATTCGMNYNYVDLTRSNVGNVLVIILALLLD
jgi:hypothetical protein